MPRTQQDRGMHRGQIAVLLLLAQILCSAGCALLNSASLIILIQYACIFAAHQLRSPIIIVLSLICGCINLYYVSAYAVGNVQGMELRIVGSLYVVLGIWAIAQMLNKAPDDSDIETIRSLEQEVLMSRSEEQQRIGRDLHDGLGQELTGIALHVQSLHTELADLSEQQHERFDKILTLINHSIDHTRSLVRGLCPVMDNENGLRDALNDLVESAKHFYHINCSISISEELPRLDIHQSSHLFYICKEALTNAIKHSQASQISIAIQTHGKNLTLEVNDNGNGFEMNDSLLTRGLKIMRYRSHMLKGELKIKSTCSNGTTVSCFVRLTP